MPDPLLLHTQTGVAPSVTPLLSRDVGISLVEQIVRLVQVKIDDKLLRPGGRMPSIRQFAELHGVSRFTVVEAYDRLVGLGFLESRRGSGFYVREGASLRPAVGPVDPVPSQLDVVWLLRSVFREVPRPDTPGSGMFPNDWLDSKLVSDALRAVSRQSQATLLQYGHPQGFLPLRQQLQVKLSEASIAATPGQIVTTAGATQALDLVARHFLQPGDTVFVDDPGWYIMFGTFALLGARLIGIPRLADGPDITKLAELAALHKPRLYVINSVLHNPSSTSLSAAKAYQVLRLADLHDFTVVEDDVHGDLHPGSRMQPATRLAALDQLSRVIYLGSFSKTLAANLRVGFLATTSELAKRLAERKLLESLTSSEIGERVVYKVLSEGHYRKHVDRLCSRLAQVRDRVIRQLERIGMHVAIPPAAGLFVWVDTGCDTVALTERALEKGYLLAPGALFSPKQLPSTHMRINIACMADPGLLRWLEREVGARR
jgi:DNA-binding transcriptional MocR family regulator